MAGDDRYTDVTLIASTPAPPAAVHPYGLRRLSQRASGRHRLASLHECEGAIRPNGNAGGVAEVSNCARAVGVPCFARAGKRPRLAIGANGADSMRARINHKCDPRGRVDNDAARIMPGDLAARPVAASRLVRPTYRLDRRELARDGHSAIICCRASTKAAPLLSAGDWRDVCRLREGKNAADPPIVRITHHERAVWRERDAHRSVEACTRQRPIGAPSTELSDEWKDGQRDGLVWLVGFACALAHLLHRGRRCRLGCWRRRRHGGGGGGGGRTACRHGAERRAEGRGEGRERDGKERGGEREERTEEKGEQRTGEGRERYGKEGGGGEKGRESWRGERRRGEKREEEERRRRGRGEGVRLVSLLSTLYSGSVFTLVKIFGAPHPAERYPG
eukprot:scaffold206533_cov30-Tisochrysis_lutea.AAC.7